ncbi:hypothetical protein C9374_005819 [Naegleria lovaniensis]|uniref:Uncharacterized protein n=1 Tax=Naegleria lovaniensis TaxID=51637 RepID=A0AA88GPJ5_NAELO|nr:uncharacterized protein C9374_005819 [Naegleria lovaniensis]KAG2382027.1 hypothetical protein C9374_005819 [Naegleria lovaniensis]
MQTFSSTSPACPKITTQRRTSSPLRSFTTTLLFISILIIVFFIVQSHQNVVEKPKKSQDSEQEESNTKKEPKVIILNANDDDNALDDIPEDLRDRLKLVLGQIKNQFGQTKDDQTAATKSTTSNVETKPGTTPKPTFDEINFNFVAEDYNTISYDEITKPLDYSSFLEPNELVPYKRKQEVRVTYRRKLMSKRIESEKKKTAQEPTVNEESLTTKLLEAKSILNPDLEVYDTENVAKAINIYENIITEDKSNALAMYNLATVYKTDKFGFRNFTKSKMYYVLSAALGNSMAQFEVALLYSNNLITEQDISNVKQFMIDLYGQPSEMKKKYNIIFNSLPQQLDNTESIALLNLFYSSLDGTTGANIALGYRHLFGHGVPKSCKTAAFYYVKAAEDVAAEFEDSKIPLIDHVRLNDEIAIHNKQSQEDIMDYYQYSASKGSSSSMLVVGYANLYGIRGVEQNIDAARRLFEQAAEAGEYEAYGALGNMFWKGDGVMRNNETAFKYFKKGADKKDASSLNGLGKMYLEGAVDQEGNVIIEQDYEKAAGYFNKSAALGNSEAHYNMGVLYMEGKGVKRSYKQAFQHFAIAAQHGQVLAKYQLGNMHLYGLGTNPNCDVAVKFYKSVVEKASWTSVMETAFENYVNGEDQHTALLLYMHAAELGIEVGQANLAFMYDRGYGLEEIIKGLPEEKQELLKFKGAIKWYQHAAEQGNVDAYVKVGDYYYYGSSALTSSSSIENLEQSYEKSLYFYRRAKDLNNAQAMFNLGYMHEHGRGLPQDFHLAKRHYDMAAEADPVAYVPVLLALGKLYVHWGFSLAKDYISSLFGQDQSDSSVIDDDDDYPASFSELFKNWIASYEDYLLALLIGGLLLLIFVRYIVTVQPPTRRGARRERQQVDNDVHGEDQRNQE